jgi:thioredoxin reductase (NADPH)
LWICGWGSACFLGLAQRRQPAQALAMRARIVLKAPDGENATATASEMKVCLQTVGKWRKRYAERGAISGQRLASRAQLQALKFGVKFAISRDVVTAEQIDGIHKLTLAGGAPACSRSVVVASGAQYRRLSAANYSKFENRGIYYAATAIESLLCRDDEVVVVGGGNSAGQAAMFLSGIANHVHHIIRGESLTSSMSQYLVSRVESSTHITLYSNSEIEKLEGKSSLEQVTWANRMTGKQTVS